MDGENIEKEIQSMMNYAIEPKIEGDESLGMDEFDHAVLAFELLATQMQRVTDDPYQWVWAIIALHNGIQGMMVLALTGTNGLNALRKRDRKLKLDDFLKLYKKVRRNDRLNFVPGDGQNLSVETLNSCRNLFIHYPHQMTVFDRKEFHPIASDCLEVAGRLFAILTDGSPENLHRGNALIWSKPAMKERLQAALTLARQLLDSRG